MSWYGASTTTIWRKRKAISVVDTTGTGTADINVTIPTAWHEFWELIDTAAAELRVTAADGVTLLSYSVDNGSGGAFSRSAKTGRIQIDGATLPGTAAELGLIWVYYDSVSAQGAASVATTIASALSGYIELGVPNRGSWVSAGDTPRLGSTTPRTRHGKDPADATSLWLDVTDQLELSPTSIAGRKLYEEPYAANYTIVNAAASAQSAMIDTTLMRWVEYTTGTGGRKMYLRLHVKSGSDATQYTALPIVKTSCPGISGVVRTLNPRVGFRVVAVLET